MAKTTFAAFQIVETDRKDDDGKPVTYWNRIGAAFENRDGSINVVLQALPLDGKLQLRIPKAK